MFREFFQPISDKGIRDYANCIQCLNILNLKQIFASMRKTISDDVDQWKNFGTIVDTISNYQESSDWSV